MTREQFEELLLKIADSNQLLSVAVANITEINSEIMDKFRLLGVEEDSDAGPTLQ